MHTCKGRGTLTTSHTSSSLAREELTAPVWGALAITPPLGGPPWLTQVGLDPLKVCRPAYVLEGISGLGIENVHVHRAACTQVLGPGRPREEAGARTVSPEQSAPTTPGRPRDSPDNAVWH